MARAVGVAIAMVLLCTPGAAGAQAPRTYGPTVSWGGMRVRSLAPWPRPGAEASAAPATEAKPRKDGVLSNERTFTRWAYVARPAAIYRSATSASPRIARTHWYTEDGFPEVYLLLREHRNAAGHEWVKIRIPGRPNGRTGWVQRHNLGRFHLTHMLIVVNRERVRMYVYSWGKLIWSAPVGVGKPSTPTPAGHFWIREEFKISDPSSGYWPYAFGTADYSTLSDWPGGGIVGIHGPYYQPQLIPGHPSHGCIRLHTGDDAWLAGHVGVGTPLHVV